MAAISASPVLAKSDSLSCRSQLHITCQKKCLVEKAPADLAFAFDKKTLTYCRGEQCDEGKLQFSDESGQWNDKPYRVFSARKAGGHGFYLSGVVDLSAKTFIATTSDTPQLLGTCE